MEAGGSKKGAGGVKGLTELSKTNVELGGNTHKLQQGEDCGGSHAEAEAKTYSE